jgi:hypothetical protein
VAIDTDDIRRRIGRLDELSRDLAARRVVGVVRVEAGEVGRGVIP